MRKSRFSDEQIIAFLKEHQAGLGMRLLHRHPTAYLADMDIVRFRLLLDARP
jgi:hypothetical protein